MRRATQPCVARSPCRPLTVRVSAPWLSTTTQRFNSDNTSSKQLSFPGFTLDPLSAPLRSIIPPTRTLNTPPPAEQLFQNKDEERLAKYRQVFGSRLAEPAERRAAIEAASTDVGGVLVPPKPDEPENCCMSGCVNCVWDLFRDELEEWAAKSKEARMKVDAQRRQEQRMEGENINEDGDGSGMGWDGEGGGGSGGSDLFEGIPVGIREFMKTEKKLKERHARQSTSGG